MTEVFLESYLDSAVKDVCLRQVVLAIAAASIDIAAVIETADTGKAGTFNVYGEEQLALDVLSDRIMQEKLKASKAVSSIVSEELPDELVIGDGDYAVAHDPLDGSSLVDVNLSVGTIFSIYQNDHFTGLTGDAQVAAGFVVYGPRTTMMLTLRDGVREFSLRNGRYILTHDDVRIAESGKMFAPGNLRACAFRQDYLDLMEYWLKEQYTLRYSGGMVPDINQILLKGKGIFTYPGYQEAPDGKLRLLVECNAMALLVEQAGGKATDGKKRILEKEICDIEQRTPILIGAIREVERAESYLRNL
jgi:fructose-1,6-bisphosphatase I